MQQAVIDAVRSLSSTNFPKGHLIYQEGAAPDDTMYFVFKGEIGIFKDRAGKEQEINKMQAGDFFGEMALIHSRPRLATARVTSDVAHLAVMDRKTLLKLSGHSPEFLFYLLRFAIKRLLAAEDKLQRVRETLQDAKDKRGL